MIDFTQFDICIDLFGKEEVTPSNAVDIIEIANRHPQASKLKKVKYTIFSKKS